MISRGANEFEERYDGVLVIGPATAHCRIGYDANRLVAAASRSESVIVLCGREAWKMTIMGDPIK
jgi:hypothetical protein